MNPTSRYYLIAICILATLLFQGCHSDNEIVIYCDEDNDLYQLLKSAGKDCQSYSDIGEALRQCEPNGALLILAKDYPSKNNDLLMPNSR